MIQWSVSRAKKPALCGGGDGFVRVERAEGGQEGFEVAVAAGVHLVIAHDGEGAEGAERPLDALEVIGGGGEAVFLDLAGVAHVVDVAEVERVVGVGGEHVGGDGFGFEGAGSPVGDDGDAEGFAFGEGRDAEEAGVACGVGAVPGFAAEEIGEVEGEPL